MREQQRKQQGLGSGSASSSSSSKSGSLHSEQTSRTQSGPSSEGDAKLVDSHQAKSNQRGGDVARRK